MIWRKNLLDSINSKPGNERYVDIEMERLDRFQVFVMERSFERSVISLLLSALQLEFEIENWIQLLEFDIRIHSISYLSIFILYSQ